MDKSNLTLPKATMAAGCLFVMVLLFLGLLVVGAMILWDCLFPPWTGPGPG
jgi:hypothetical protein